MSDITSDTGSKTMAAPAPPSKTSTVSATSSRTCINCGEEKCITGFKINSTKKDKDGNTYRRLECRKCTDLKAALKKAEGHGAAGGKEDMFLLMKSMTRRSEIDAGRDDKIADMMRDFMDRDIE